jgi:anti-sigma-K factor RskA
MTNSFDSYPTSPDCDAVSALIPAYVLGATDPEETRFVERYLQDCPDALADLRTYSEMQDALLLASPAVDAPAPLASAVQERIREESPRQSPVVMPRTAQPSSSTGRTTWWITGVAAALTLLLITNLYWMSHNNRMMEQAARAQTLQRERNTAIAALTAEDTQMTQLDDPRNGNMSGSIVWSSEKQMAMISVANLPQTTPNQEYQLWFMDDDEEVSMGTFRVQDDGMGMMIFDFEQPIEEFEAIGVTVEPTGGSTEPTTSPVLMGDMDEP